MQKSTRSTLNKFAASLLIAAAGLLYDPRASGVSVHAILGACVEVCGLGLYALNEASIKRTFKRVIRGGSPGRISIIFICDTVLACMACVCVFSGVLSHPDITVSFLPEALRMSIARLHATAAFLCIFCAALSLGLHASGTGPSPKKPKAAVNRVLVFAIGICGLFGFIYTGSVILGRLGDTNAVSAVTREFSIAESIFALARNASALLCMVAGIVKAEEAIARIKKSKD